MVVSVTPRVVRVVGSVVVPPPPAAVVVEAPSSLVLSEQLAISNEADAITATSALRRERLRLGGLGPVSFMDSSEGQGWVWGLDGAGL